MDQSTKTKKRSKSPSYKFIKWAYGNKFAIIDQLDANLEPLRRFIGVASDFGIEPKEG